MYKVSEEIKLLRYGSGAQRVRALRRLMPGYLDNAVCFFAFDRFFDDGTTRYYVDELFGLKSAGIEGVFPDGERNGVMSLGDGIDDYVNIGGLGLEPLLQDFSFSIVLHQHPDHTYAVNQNIIANRTRQELTSWALSTGSTDGSIKLSCANIEGSSASVDDIRNAPVIVHGTLKRDDNMILSTNGQSRVTTSIAAGAANSMSQSAFNIWRRALGTFTYWGGWGKDFILWHNKILTTEEIKLHARLGGYML